MGPIRRGGAGPGIRERGSVRGFVCRLAWALLIAFPALCPAQALVQPYEKDVRFLPANRIDRIVASALRRKRIRPAHLCSDEVFLRRVYLDTTGRLPLPREVADYLRDPRPDRDAALIDERLASDGFAAYQSLLWCDILRVKAEFPINLWPNAVQAYHRWIFEAVRDNMPYDRFARELLTSSGSNFRVPAVNFYRAIQGRDPGSIAAAVALTFMGERVEHWPAERRAGFEAFFSRVAYKGTAEWKEEIVLFDPAPAGPLEAVYPDGTPVTVPPDVDPRTVFADWLIADGNPAFARNAVNRVWYRLLGRGIVHEPDDMRPDNPPTIPPLLDYLQKELVSADYDLRHIYRLILNSRVYRQSPIPQSDDPDTEAFFAVYPVRRLDAEVLIDALSSVFGSGEEYSSRIPEPFTFIPPSHPTVELADGSTTSQFLEMFGRPARDTGLESERNNRPTDAQRLHLLNSGHIRQKIEGNRRFPEGLRNARGKPDEAIRFVYLALLSRRPTDEETRVAREYLRESGLDARKAAQDVAWALVNSKEFLYRH